MGEAVVCVQVHGDAALSAQGVDQETLQLANVPHFSVGGSIHFAVNNQVTKLKCSIQSSNYSKLYIIV